MSTLQICCRIFLHWGKQSDSKWLCFLEVCYAMVFQNTWASEYLSFSCLFICVYVFLCHLPPYFLKQHLSLKLKLTERLDWLAVPWSPPISSSQSLCYGHVLPIWAFGSPNPGCHTGAADTLSTEPLLQPINCGLFVNPHDGNIKWIHI